MADFDITVLSEHDAFRRAFTEIEQLDDVEQLRTRWPELADQLEPGGLLLGWTDDATGDAVVAAIVGPGPAAEHGSTSFLPDHDWQCAELARQYAGSGRVHGYLGDWHTHPSGTGRPSARDRRTLASIAAAPLARAPRPLLAIVAGGPDGSVHLWRHRRRHLPAERLVPKPYGS